MSRVIKKNKPRNVKESATRRVSSNDSKFARYAEIKSSTGIVLPEVKKVLLDRKALSAKSDVDIVLRRSKIMYPSEMSRNDWCPRATYYRMSGYPEPESSTSFNLENVFAEGNSVHNKWQGWLSDTGKLWGDWRCIRCGAYVKESHKPPPTSEGSYGAYTDCVGTGWVTINGATLNEDYRFEHDWKYKEVTLKAHSLPISGHADGALTGHDCLIELKSLGIGSLRFEAPKLLEQHTYDIKGRKIVDIDGIWRDFHRPLAAHVRQGNLYLWMSQEMCLPFKKISFVYEFKPNNQSKEFVIPYSQEIVQPMLDMASTIIKAVSDKIPPICPKGGCMNCKPYERQQGV